MSIPKFLERLKKAAPEFEWSNAGNFESVWIRGKHKKTKAYCCPITAVHYSETREHISNHCAMSIAESVELSRMEADQVIDAADGILDTDLVVQLCKAVGVKI